jgi:hemerythrin-like metal-binding protein
MMHVFTWNEHFLTGFPTVDTQHQRLFELINQMGEILAAPQPVTDRVLDEVFRALAAYAAKHFKEEERLMQEAGVPVAYFEQHVQVHRDFVAQVKQMWSQRSILSSPAETIHGFLAAWLSSHILGDDQEMAREIHRARGEPERGEKSAAYGFAAAEVLQLALRILYKELMCMNQDLAEVNRGLEAKVAERTRELLQAEKMASIGQLAAGVAHEINNPIGFVNSNLGTLEHYVTDLLRLAEHAAATPAGAALRQEIDLDFLRTDTPDLVHESQDGLDRVRRIVASLKDFSRVDEAEWQEADLLAGLESTLNVALHELKYKAELQRELAPLPRVRCIPAQLNQVFLNLLVNAVQAIPEHGTITLRSGTEAQRVWIEIADTGCGMDEETQRRIFEPFFTTKPVGTGTGLGMSLTWDIIKKHGGSIDVNSTVGQGTTIRIWLPIAGPAGS